MFPAAQRTGAIGTLRLPDRIVMGSMPAESNYSCGVVFEITAGGIETPLYNFKGGSDGCGPTSVASLRKRSAVRNDGPPSHYKRLQLAQVIGERVAAFLR